MDNPTSKYVSNGSFVCLMLVSGFSQGISVSKSFSDLAGYSARVSVLISTLKYLKRKNEGDVLPVQSKDGKVQTEISIGKEGKGQLIVDQNSDSFKLQNVTCSTPNGRKLFKNLSLEIKQGVNLLIIGPNGAGKTTLLRILNGLWSHFEGQVIRPPLMTDESAGHKRTLNVFYLPQRPYLFYGTLKEQISYPYREGYDMISDDQCKDLLELVGLSYLLPKKRDSSGRSCIQSAENMEKLPSVLDQSQSSSGSNSNDSPHQSFNNQNQMEGGGNKDFIHQQNEVNDESDDDDDEEEDDDEEQTDEYLEKEETTINWADLLSPGEQQLISFARVFYHQPKFVILDESTSALTQEAEKKMYQLCMQRGITLLSVGQRKSLLSYHHMLLRFSPDRKWKLEAVDPQGIDI